MGLFDKIKNMFTEEVEDDVKVEQIKSDVTHVTIESPKVKEERLEETGRIDFTQEKVNTPVFFDDNDFKDLKLDKKEEKKEEKKVVVEKEIYGSKIAPQKEKEEKKVFKPTPIISPVYGVLDKNYHKEDIVSRQDYIDEKSNKDDSNTEPSIDSIRNKAYGTLEDELENTLFGNNSILFKHGKDEDTEDEKVTEIEDNILSDLTDDIGKELDELLVKKEKYLEPEEKKEKNKEEDKPKDSDDDILNFIDSTLYSKEGDEE